MTKKISMVVDEEHIGDVLKKIIDLSVKENGEERNSSAQTERKPRSIQITLTEQL